LPNMPGSAIGAISIGDIFGKALGNRAKPRRTTVKDAHAPLIVEESDKMIDQDQIVQEAIREVENNGIVFLDEIDKICAREGRGGGDVSREGVQRDLLPLIEGTTVATKHGTVKTDHILFIASGAHRTRSEPHQAIRSASPHRRGRAFIYARSDQRGGADRGAGQFLGRKYRRATVADRDGTCARRGELHRVRPVRREDRNRCGIRREKHRRPREKRRLEPVHSLAVDSSIGLKDLYRSARVQPIGPILSDQGLHDTAFHQGRELAKSTLFV
jgi:hypothetical protein